MASNQDSKEFDELSNNDSAVEDDTRSEASSEYHEPPPYRRPLDNPRGLLYKCNLGPLVIPTKTAEIPEVILHPVIQWMRDEIKTLKTISKEQYAALDKKKKSKCSKKLVEIFNSWKMWATPMMLGDRPLVGRGDMFFHATLARTFIQSLRVRGDDDFVDRLNSYYTPIMLAIACLVISAKQYGGTPIECWVNPHSRESMEEYIESYCWITNTYWVPMFENIPDDHTAREQQQIGYYQWVPFILIAEALMFTIPSILWRLLNWQMGLNIQNVVATASEVRSVVDQIEREKIIESIANSVVDILDLQDPQVTPHPSNSWLGKLKANSAMRGHYVTILYVFVKLCYTSNIMLQFILLNTALKSDEYLLFGFQVLSDLYSGKPWTESGHFPRVTLCDFEVRYLANLNRYTVQCALLINIINEKVFAFFWCWYLMLAVITTCSALFWITNILLTSEKVDYVLKYMQIAESSDRKKRAKPATDSRECAIDEAFKLPDAYLLNKFVLSFLKSDGVFTLRLMANHAGELVVVNVVKQLWIEFRDRNWKEFEEYESYKRHTFRLPPTSNQRFKAKKNVEIRFDPKSSNHSVMSEPVTIANPLVAPRLTDSVNEKVV